MVQSSIVIPANSSIHSRKRSTDDSITAIDPDAINDDQAKRPRLTDDSEDGKRRNKRLFGSLLGTLSKFKNETEKSSQVDKNRREIDKKLQDKLEVEKKQLQEKLQARKLEKQRLSEEKLQEEQREKREKREWIEIKQNEALAGFLKTTTEPSLCYLPEKLLNEMEEAIKEQKEKTSLAREEFEKRRPSSKPVKNESGGNDDGGSGRFKRDPNSADKEEEDIDRRIRENSNENDQQQKKEESKDEEMKSKELNDKELKKDDGMDVDKDETNAVKVEK